MRARSIKPGLFKNETLGTADPLFTLIFEGLWCLADREGRLENRPLRIHVEVNPYRDSASTVQALDWLVQHGFITRYEHDGTGYLEIANFRKHQQPHVKEAASKIPAPINQGVVEAPDKHCASTSLAALTPDSGLLTPDCGVRAREPRPPKRPSRKCPEDFVVPLEAREGMQAECPSVDLDRETAKFRDHTFATARTDWLGTWRNWIRKAAEISPGKRTTGRQPHGMTYPDGRPVVFDR